MHMRPWEPISCGRFMIQRARQSRTMLVTGEGYGQKYYLCTAK